MHVLSTGEVLGGSRDVLVGDLLVPLAGDDLAGAATARIRTRCEEVELAAEEIREVGPRSCRQEGGAERVAGHRRHELDLRVLELSDESRVAAGQLEHAVDGRRLRERLRIDERQLFLDAHRELTRAVEDRTDVVRRLGRGFRPLRRRIRAEPAAHARSA